LSTPKLEQKKIYMRPAKIWPYVFAAPFLLSYAAFSLYPTLYSFFLSLYDWDGIGEKVFVGLSNYMNLFSRDALFYKSLYNTILIMLLSTPAALIVGMFLAHTLFQMGKGKQFFQTAFFLPYITMPVVIGFIFSYMFDWSVGYVNLFLIKIGLLKEGYYWLQDSFTARLIVALMIIWRYFGYYTTIYLAGMTAIPAEIYEAAKVDGATGVKTFFAITLPMLRNVSVFLIVTSVICGLQMFDEPLLLFTGWGNTVNVGGPDYSVLTVIWKFYNDTFKSNSMLGYGAAISYALFFIIIILSLISYKLSAGKDER
jgi:cellobiose transport system permease protein